MLFKKILIKIVRSVLGRALSVSLKNAKDLAIEYGQFRTVKEWSSINADRLPIPWYTYPAIEYLDNFNLTNLSVLEYGSGNSSLYYLRKGATVTSVEDDKDWYDKIKCEVIQDGFTYVFAPSESEYVQRSEIDSADIIVIDGSYRTDCANFTISKIKEGSSQPSMVILDNSDRYPKSIRKMDKELNWVRADFCGFCPIVSHTSVTSIYLNPNKILPRIEGHIASICGTGVNKEP